MNRPEYIRFLTKNRKYLVAVFLLFVLGAAALVGESTSAPTSQKVQTSTTSSLWLAKDGQSDNLPSSTDTVHLQGQAENYVYQEEPWWSLLLGLVVKLAIVVALIYLTVMGLRMFIFKRKTLSQPARNLNILESQPLGQTVALHLVQVGDKFLLIGAGTNEVRVLSEVDAASIEATASMTARLKEAAGESFSAQLEQLTKGVAGKLPAGQNTIAGAPKELPETEDWADSKYQIEEALETCGNHMHKRSAEIKRLAASWEQRSLTLEFPVEKKSVAAAASRSRSY